MISWRAFGASRDCADKDAQIKKMQDAIYEMAEENVKMKKKMLKYAAQANAQKWSSEDVRAHVEHLRIEITKMVSVNNDLRREVNNLKSHKAMLQQETGRMKKRLNVARHIFQEDIQKDQIPVRLSNALEKDDINTYADLLEISEAELLRTPNIARKSLQYLREHIQSKFPEYYYAFNFMVDQ